MHFQETRRETETGDLLGVPELAPGASDSEAPALPPSKGRKKSKFSETPTEAEIFIFEYGTVVIWGMTEAQERRFLSSLYAFTFPVLQLLLTCCRKRFEVERLGQLQRWKRYSMI